MRCYLCSSRLGPKFRGIFEWRGWARVEDGRGTVWSGVREKLVIYEEENCGRVHSA